MNERERVLAVLRGQRPDRVPWVAKLQLWYNARLATGTMPQRLSGLSLWDSYRELGIGITAYGVLSRGLISGHWSKTREGQRDFRTNAPRFQGANLDANLALVEKLRAIAQTIGASVSPSPGSRSRAKTSCRSSAPGDATVSPRLSARST